MQKIPVWVVSLADATERRTVISEHLNSLEIEFSFLNAVRGSEVNPEIRLKLNPRQNMSNGALGCYMSHISIYEKMCKAEIPVALILEDDARLNHRIKALLEGGLQTKAFDYCFLGCDDLGVEGYIYYDTGSAVELGANINAYELSSGPYCTHAYLITLEGAKKRLASAYPATGPIDHYHALPYRPDFRAVVPALAYVNELSAVDSMSSLAWSSLQVRLRKHWWYYDVRDLLKMKPLRKWLAGRALSPAKFGRWRGVLSGFRVAREKHFR